VNRELEHHEWTLKAPRVNKDEEWPRALGAPRASREEEH
jgi:hypothetical protein